MDATAGGGKNFTHPGGVGIQRSQQLAGIGLERLDGRTFFGQFDGRLEERGQRETAVVAGQGAESGDVAGHGDGGAAQVETLGGRAEIDGDSLKIHLGGRTAV